MRSARRRPIMRTSPMFVDRLGLFRSRSDPARTATFARADVDSSRVDARALALRRGRQAASWLSITPMIRASLLAVAATTTLPAAVAAEREPRPGRSTPRT